MLQVIKEDIERALKNTNMKPLNHSSYLRLQILRQCFWDVEEKLCLLNDLSLSELRAFIPGLLSQVWQFKHLPFHEVFQKLWTFCVLISFIWLFIIWFASCYCWFFLNEWGHLYYSLLDTHTGMTHWLEGLHCALAKQWAFLDIYFYLAIYMVTWSNIASLL